MVKKRLFCLLLCAALLLLAGCANTSDWQSMQDAAQKMGDQLEDPQLRQDTLAMLGCIIAGEEEKAYQLVSGVISQEDFREPYALMREHLQEAGSFELVAAYKSVRVQNGTNVVSIRYLMTAGESRFLVEAGRADGITGLAGFYVSPYVEVQQTGTITTLEDANWLQWVFLIIGILEVIFLLVMLADCCFHKMEKKWVWILLILAGSLSVLLLSTEKGLKVNYNYGLIFSYTALLRYSTGGFMARIYVPIGAIAYAIFRKKLFATYEALHTQAVPPELPAEKTE